MKPGHTVNHTIPVHNMPEMSFIDTIWKWLNDNLLLVLTILSAVLGVVLGNYLRQNTPDDDFIMFIGFPGDLFIRMLKMLTVPLIVSSMIASMAQSGTTSSGRMGVRTIVYYLSTTMIAVMLGIVMVLVIHPYDPEIEQETMPSGKNTGGSVSSLDSILDLVRNLFPENLIQATFSQIKTNFVRGNRLYYSDEKNFNWDRVENKTIEVISLDGNNISTEIHFYKLTRSFQYRKGPNVLGLIVFYVLFGIMCSKLGSEADLIIRFFVELNAIVMRLFAVCMWYSPVGIASLITAKIAEITDIHTVAQQLVQYILTVTAGLVIHSCVSYPLIYFVVTKKNPLTFYKGMLQAWITAIGTASSAATLPVTIRCLEENIGIDKRVSLLFLALAQLTKNNQDNY